MDEGTSKAIPLRRSRGNGNGRAMAVRTASEQTGPGWTARIASGARRAFDPPRQLWLAGLGGTTLTVRAAIELWALLVSEGAATEAWVRGTLGRRDRI